MAGRDEGLEPIGTALRPWRRRLGLRHELSLALLPTMTVLVMLVLLEAFSQQRLLFGSLASSAFLIYVDPLHSTNHIRTLILAHLSASILGFFAFLLLGHGYPAAGLAMVATIVVMIVGNVVHPPAVATSLIFALRSGAESEFTLFLLALSIVVILVILQRVAIWLFRRVDQQ